MKTNIKKSIIRLSFFLLIPIILISCDDSSEPSFSLEQLKGTWMCNQRYGGYIYEYNSMYSIDSTSISFYDQLLEVEYYRTYSFSSPMTEEHYTEVKRIPKYFTYKIENDILKVYKADSGNEKLISSFKVKVTSDSLNISLKDGRMFLYYYDLFPNNVGFKRINQ